MVSQIAIDIRPDWDEQNQSNLQFINTMTGILALVLVIYTSTLPHSIDSAYNITPWVALFVFQLVAFALPRQWHIGAALLTLASFIVAFGAQYLYIDPDPMQLLLFVIPILLAPIIMDHKYLPYITLVDVSIIILLYLQTDLVAWLSLDFIMPVGMALLAATVGYTLDTKTNNLVNWAVDSQTKNFVRAESFYAQREKLNEALLELKKTNAELERVNVALGEARRKAEEANNAKSVFLSNVSHELRTPLNMVIGYTSSMLNMPQMYDHQHLPPIFRDDIQLINSSGQYLLTLINDLLDLSKIEAGRLELAMTAFDIVEVFKGVIATSLGLVKDKPLQIIPDYPDDLPLIWGDPIRVRQILLNLMSNGVKYTDSGSVTLHADVRETRLYIAVTDTGAGIPADLVETIFERFGQVKQNPEIQGTGLGLDISQRLADLHATRIDIDTEIGRGSTFSFFLQLATSEQIEATTTSPNVRDTDSVVKIFDGVEELWDTHSVLIVEDEAETRTMLYRIFESNSFVTFDTNDGSKVVEMALGILPELIVLDINLPTVDGWQVLHELRHQPELAHVAVLVLTAQNNFDHPEAAYADVCLSKPISADAILDHARQVLKTKTAQ